MRRTSSNRDWFSASKYTSFLQRLEHPRNHRATSRKTQSSEKPSKHQLQTENTEHCRNSNLGRDEDESFGKATTPRTRAEDQTTTGDEGSKEFSSFVDNAPIYNTALPDRCRQQHQHKRSTRKLASDTDIRSQNLHGAFKNDYQKNVLVEGTKQKTTDRVFGSDSSGKQDDHRLFKESPVSPESENLELDGDCAVRDRRMFRVAFYEPAKTDSHHDATPEVIGKACSRYLALSDEDLSTDDEDSSKKNKIWEGSTFTLMLIFIVLRLTYETWYGENCDFLLGNAFQEGESSLLGFVDNESDVLP